MTPICHRLAAAWVTGRASMTTKGASDTYPTYDDYELTPTDASEAVACIGSHCAVWIPSGHGPVSGRPIDPTRGNCADNPYAPMWPDPAKESR